jgi:hypothetical protein
VSDNFFADNDGLSAVLDEAASSVQEGVDELDPENADPGYDEDAEDDSLPIEDDDEVDPDAEEIESPDDEEPEPDSLEAREAALAEREARIAAAEAERQQAQAAQAWTQTWENGMAWFGQAEAQVWANAERSQDPDGYVREGLARLNNKREQWIIEFYQNREGHLQEAYAKSRIPEFAAHLVKEYRLPKEDLKKLMRYQNDPDMMAMVAKDMRDIRQTQKSLAADKRAGSQPGPGTSTGSQRRAPRNLDQMIDQLFSDR